MLLELDPLTLSRHGHHYKDPARRSFLEVVGVSDREGGTVEVRLSLLQSGISKNGRREPVPSSERMRVVLTLTPGEARELSERLRESALGVGYADCAAAAPVLPYMVDLWPERRGVRYEWAHGCSPACQLGHAAPASASAALEAGECVL